MEFAQLWLLLLLSFSHYPLHFQDPQAMSVHSRHYGSLKHWGWQENFAGCADSKVSVTADAVLWDMAETQFLTTQEPRGSHSHSLTFPYRNLH